MSNSFYTDGMYGTPVVDTGCLDSIEAAIAFDVRDWSEDRRSAWIYGIVFGWADAEDAMKEKFGWDEDDISRLHKYHAEWEMLHRIEKESEGRNDNIE